MSATDAATPDQPGSPAGESTREPRNQEPKQSRFVRETRCRFCRRKVRRVDYKDVITLQDLCRGQGRIIAGNRAGNCARHQRMVKRAIKQARFIGLMSYTEGQQRGPGKGW